MDTAITAKRRNANGDGTPMPTAPTTEAATEADAAPSRLDELDALITRLTSERDAEANKGKSLRRQMPADGGELPTLGRAVNELCKRQEDLTREIAFLREERRNLWAAGARSRRVATQAQRIGALHAVREAHAILRSARDNAQRILNLGSVAGAGRAMLPVVPRTDLETAVDGLLRVEGAL